MKIDTDSDMTSNTIGNHTHNNMREPEACKLFIGQVPRTWTEKDLRPTFEAYGEIHDLTILHDKYTGHQKGSKLSFPFLFVISLSRT